MNGENQIHEEDVDPIQEDEVVLDLENRESQK